MTNETFGPYSPIRQAGNTYFISGQIGIDTRTKQASENITTQTRQALSNLKDVLTIHNLTMQHVVKTTIYLQNMDDFSRMNDAYEVFFTPPRPARSTIAVGELPRLSHKTTLLVEIEAVAYKDGGVSNG